MTNSIKKGVRKIILKNIKSGECDWMGGQKYKFICPSVKTYPYQWFWDSSFHAITLSHLDTGLAKNEVENLLLGQQPSGFIPHVLFWERGIFLKKIWCYLQGRDTIHPRFTGMIQPPVLGITIELIFKKDKDIETPIMTTLYQSSRLTSRDLIMLLILTKWLTTKNQKEENLSG